MSELSFGDASFEGACQDYIKFVSLYCLAITTPLLPIWCLPYINSLRGNATTQSRALEPSRRLAMAHRSAPRSALGHTTALHYNAPVRTTTSQSTQPLPCHRVTLVPLGSAAA